MRWRAGITACGCLCLRLCGCPPYNNMIICIVVVVVVSARACGLAYTEMLSAGQQGLPGSPLLACREWGRHALKSQPFSQHENQQCQPPTLTWRCVPPTPSRPPHIAKYHNPHPYTMPPFPSSPHPHAYSPDSSSSMSQTLFTRASG